MKRKRTRITAASSRGHLASIEHQSTTASAPVGDFGEGSDDPTSVSAFWDKILKTLHEESTECIAEQPGDGWLDRGRHQSPTLRIRVQCQMRGGQ